MKRKFLRLRAKANGLVSKTAPIVAGGIGAVVVSASPAHAGLVIDTAAAITDIGLAATAILAVQVLVWGFKRVKAMIP